MKTAAIVRRSFFVLAALLATADAALAQAVPVGKEFPSFTEKDVISGRKISLEDFRGKVVLVDFWATWCGPCLQELPNVKAAYDKYHKQGFEIVSISLDKSIDACKKFVEREKMTWHHIADGKFWDARLAKRFGVMAIPKAYLIGRDGTVVSDEARGPALAAAIEKALGQKYDGGAAAVDEVEKDGLKELAAADKLRAEKKYAAALARYDEIELKYKGRPVGRQAAERARELREDPALKDKLTASSAGAQATTLEGEQAKEANRWLTLARSMAEQKNTKRAREYYQKIIETYPNSEQAKTAMKEAAKLP
jgi:peroxiredoxin